MKSGDWPLEHWLVIGLFRKFSGRSTSRPITMQNSSGHSPLFVYPYFYRIGPPWAYLRLEGVPKRSNKTEKYWPFKTVHIRAKVRSYYSEFVKQNSQLNLEPKYVFEKITRSFLRLRTHPMFSVALRTTCTFVEELLASPHPRLAATVKRPRSRSISQIGSFNRSMTLDPLDAPKVLDIFITFMSPAEQHPRASKERHHSVLGINKCHPWINHNFSFSVILSYLTGLPERSNRSLDHWPSSPTAFLY